MEHRCERRKAVALSAEIFLDGRPRGRCSVRDISFSGIGIDRPSEPPPPNGIVQLVVHSGPKRFPIRAFVTRISRTLGCVLLNYDSAYASFLVEELSFGGPGEFAKTWASEGHARSNAATEP
ncbi:MAG TPA: PilZ domain-containing protein [Gammaproteobacteria bacterium]|nr:PilZ domain-containing protein [Gammaproteobacteria bacterium]